MDPETRASPNKMLPAAIQVSDRELYDKIMAGAPPDSGQAAFVAERAELLLLEAAKTGLQTRWGAEVDRAAP